MPATPPATTLTPAQDRAVEEFVRFITGRLRNEAGVHAETAISATACLAGTYLLRSFELPLDDLEAGSPILSEQGDEHGPALLTTIIDTLATLDLSVDAARMPAAVPAEHQPQMTLLQVQLMFGVPYRNTVRSHALSEREAAFASAVAAARIIKDCATVLDPHLALAIAARGCNEGVKTVPIQVPGGERGDAHRPWYKFW